MLDPNPTAPAFHTLAEVASQPDIWRRVLADPAAPGRLPPMGERVLLLGCGTSYYIGESYAALRNARARGRTRAAIASELQYVENDESVLVLSRSGTTTDLVRAARRLARSHRVVGIVGAAGTPLLEHCRDHVLLDYADETSLIQTRFATGALTLLRRSVGEDLGALPGQAEAALSQPLPATLPGHLVFLGSGWTLGLAHEAALKCRESAGAWTEAYALMEYEHGPISAATGATLVWSLTAVPARIAAAIRATGATLREPVLDAQAELVAVHRLAVALGTAAGRDPDRPRFLSRSVEISD